MEIPEFTSLNYNVDLTVLSISPMEIYLEQNPRKITKVRNLKFSNFESVKHVRTLKKLLKCSGTIKNNELMFLGDHRQKIYEYFRRLGYSPIILP